MITDHNLYVFNRYTKQFWKENGIAQFTVPLELNRQEIKELGIEDGEMVLYGNLAVMISAQCVEKTTRGCRKKDGMTSPDRPVSESVCCPESLSGVL